LAGPDAAFLLTVGGILLAYGEFIWVGKVWFGLAGAVCALAGFSRMPLNSAGAVLILGAAVCFGLEAAFETFLSAGVLGSALWAAAFWRAGASPPLVLCVSALFGGVTTWLLSIAKRARRNKRVP